MNTIIDSAKVILTQNALNQWQDFAFEAIERMNEYEKVDSYSAEQVKVAQYQVIDNKLKIITTINNYVLFEMFIDDNGWIVLNNEVTLSELQKHREVTIH
jgi:hypothetical protein